ncbi:hypothetical protein DPMN_084800 [Dreissena polymorpha]|uniref:Uncharacterized protein n=1 Tax=Dreissena polymorpha TaxID=45954 RepID=A0A9D3YB78_DREPO|nr:hypothetical protein DPMN_084800 [Dreissena polymorpha]
MAFRRCTLSATRLSRSLSDCALRKILAAAYAALKLSAVLRSCRIGVGVALRRDVTVAREIRIRSTRARRELAT